MEGVGGAVCLSIINSIWEQGSPAEPGCRSLHSLQTQAAHFNLGFLTLRSALGRSGFHRGKRGAEAIDTRRDREEGRGTQDSPTEGKDPKAWGRGRNAHRHV